MPPHREFRLATICVLTSALVWGLIWYPYRVMEHEGIASELSALLTYAIALLCALLRFSKNLSQLKPSKILLLLALAAGFTNVGFVWAVVHGNVLRVMLLFYLLPVWTALWARWILNEKITTRQFLLILLALSGAFLVQWRPNLGLPIPENRAEWVALFAGICFGLTNVLLRKTDQYTHGVKSFWIFFGCCVIGLLLSLIKEVNLWQQTQFTMMGLGLLLLVGGLMYLINLVMQYGVSRLEANRAALLFLVELPIGALSAWLIAQEKIGWKECIGGSLIIASSLFHRKKPHHDS